MLSHRRSVFLGILALAISANYAATWVVKAEEPAPAVKPVAVDGENARSSDQNSGPEKATRKTNPYLPRKGMSVGDLQVYIERMQEAPESIRDRPGFAEGIAVAAQRILDSDPKGGLRTFAVINLLDSLHQQADLENDLDADKRLAELATKYAADPDKKIASDASFYALEQQVINADALEPAKLPDLLDEVSAALKGQNLDAKHLRIASATVHAINQMKDDVEASKRLKEFGALFAASSNPVLARYGKKLAQSDSSGGQETAWVGKPMEVAGTTSEGAKFDIAQYKGKVVLVDFWATWCGPCRELMPDLQQMYQKYHAEGFEIVGIDLDGTPADLSDFLDKEKLPWVNVVGEEKDGQLQFPLADKYGIQAIPATFLVGKDGKIVAVDLHGEELAKQIEKLLGDQSEAKPSDAKSEAK